MIMDKRGATLTNWVFVIMLVLTFLIVLQTSILSPMNSIYNQSLETGLNTSYLDEFTSLKTNTDTVVGGAEATQTSDGLTLKDSWTVGLAVYKSLTGFLDGSFLETLLTDTLDLPDFIAPTLTVMIWLSLIFAIIYIFMKVVP